ncbi:hypothetical protein C0J52_21118 [Blattella germanica]|nr:hypothetical protein C0J52_21118 [Blattella germanica]
MYCHLHPQVVDSRARNLADGSVQQRQRKQLEVFQAQVPGGSLQVIRTQSVTSTSSSRTVVHGNISSDFENLQVTNFYQYLAQLNLNPLDLSTQKTKASVGRSGSISSRRPPSRPRSLINKPISGISEVNSFLSAEKQDVENRLSEVSRLCRQFHDEAKQTVSTPSVVSIGSGDDDVVSNGHAHSVLIRKKSCSTEDLQNSEHDGEEKSGEDAGMMADWKRASKFRRSLQFPSKGGGQLDLIPNGSVSKICKEIEESRKENAMKNTTSNFESLESILRMKNKLLNENITTDKSENEPEAFTRRISPIKTAPQKRHSFVTVESLKEVRGRLRRLGSPPLNGIQHNAPPTKAADDSDDGIETEESNKATDNNSHVKTYMYGMSALNNGIRKAVPGTGSLESRTSNRSSSSSGSRSEEWYNRRKSYGFEQVHGHQNGSQPQSMSLQDKNRVESSTDSGICRSSETVTASSWSQLFGRSKDNAEDSSIKVSHSIQIKRDGSDSDSRGAQKGRRTVVTLGSESLKDSLAKPRNSHVSSFATDKSARRLSEPVTVSIPIIADGADINGNVDSKRIYFRQLSEGTNLGVESSRRKSGSFLENGSCDKNLSDETKSLAARRELLMKHRAAQETGMPFRPWGGNGRAYSSKQGDSEIKRHSIAVDETKYVRNNLQKNDYFSYDSGFTKSIPDFENGDCKISVDFRSAAAVEDEDDESFLQQLAGKKQKKVEFCKTEVHFAAEPGRFNIVETDEKPPPTNMFRRRRRNSISNLTTTAQTQEANRNSLPEIRFGDSLYEKKLLGGTEGNPPGALSLDSSSLNASLGLKRAEPVVAPGFQDVADKEDIIYTQANATILASVRQEVSEAAVFNDLEEVNGDLMQAGSRPRSILKNNRRPRPFHLGETEEESFSSSLGSMSLEPETRWGVRLKPVQTKEPAMWRSTVSLQNSSYENQQQSFNQTEEKFPKHVTSLENSTDETELQKLLKSLRPASQRKSTSDVFLSPEPKENGVEIKISTPLPVQPASWSVAERVRQVEDWKLGSMEAKGYSTRVNFGAGEATVVESDGQQRHATPSVSLYQPNNQRKPMWLRREERKMETADEKKQTVSDKGLVVHIGKNEDSGAKNEAFRRREGASPTKTTTIMIDLSPSSSDNKLFQRDFENKMENSKSKKLATAAGHTGSLRSPSLIMKTISKSSLFQDVGSEDDVLFIDNSQRSLNSNSEDSNQTSVHNESETDSSSEANHAVKSPGKENKDDDKIVVPNQLAALKELYYNAELSDDSERADEEVRSYMSGGGDEDDRERDEDVSSVVSGSWSRMRAFRNIQQHFNKIAAQSQKGKTEVSSPAKLKDCRDVAASFQRSVATAQVESYNDSNRLRTVETLVSTRSGHPKITSISLRYEGDEKTRRLEYAVPPNLSGSQGNFSSLHISEPIDLKHRVINKDTFRVQKTKEKSPERKLSAADERNYENINPRTPERKSSSFSLDQSAATSLKRRSCPEYENTVSLFSKENPQKISMDFAVKNNLKTSVKETKRQSSSSLSSRQQQQQRKISLSSLDSPSDHSPTRKETNVEVRRRLYHPKSEENRKQGSTVTDAKSTKQDALLSHTSKEKDKLVGDRSRSPSKSKPKEDAESHIYENITPSSKDGVETESVILEELTRAADQILQAVNGYTDEESYKASSDDDERDDSFRSGRRRGKRYQVRKVSGILGTISESPSPKKQTETVNGAESHKNDSNKRNQRLPKTRLGPTSSTSSIESFTKEVARSSSNHGQEQRKSKASTANGAVKSSARSARLLQRASSRELLLQTYGSSSEDGGSIRKPAVPRRSRHNSVITKTDSVTTSAKKATAESQQSPVAKARQRKRDTATSKPKERLSGSTNKAAPQAKKTSAGDAASKSRSSRSRDEEKFWRGSSHPGSSRRETSDLRHRAQAGGSAAVGEATGHDKTERAERRATKSPSVVYVPPAKPHCPCICS